MRHPLFLAALAGLVTVAGCEPASIADARDQIRRGPARTTNLVFPIRFDTLNASEFLSEDDTVTRPNGILGMELEADSVSVRVGERLRFDNVTFDPFEQSFPGFPGAAGTVIQINVNHQSLASERQGRLQAVDTVIIESGTLTLTTQSKLPVSLSYTVTLNGFIDSTGVVITRNGVVPPANGTGGTTSNTVNISLAGVTLRPGAANLAIAATATLTGAPINAAVNTNTVVQNGTGSFVVRALAGSLNPATTPELIVTVENSEVVARSSLDFGDFESAVSGLTIQDATAQLTVRNAALIPMLLSNFTLGAVRLDASGQIVRAPGGAPAYERDGAGAPILLSIVDPASVTMSIASGGTKTISLAAAPLIDRVVHLLLSDTSVALVAAGTARAGNGTQGRITRTDDVSVTFGLSVGLDFTIPDSGVVFRPDSSTRTDGLDLDTGDADDLLEHLVAAGAISRVENGTPFAVTVEAAIVAGRHSALLDVFGIPGSLPLATVTVPAATVDASGRVTQPSDAEITVLLNANQVRPFLGADYTIGTRIRLRPAAGGNGRAALRATDVVILRARAEVSVQSGSQ